MFPLQIGSLNRKYFEGCRASNGYSGEQGLIYFSYALAGVSSIGMFLSSYYPGWKLDKISQVLIRISGMGLGVYLLRCKIQGAETGFLAGTLIWYLIYLGVSLK